jgi:hypothetical protein
VQWRVRKECIDQTLSFTSELSKEIQTLSLQARVLAEHRVMQGVRRLGEVLDFTKSKREIEGLLSQGVHRVEDLK